MLSPLQLKKHVFTEMAVEAIPTGKPDAGSHVQAQVTVAHEEGNDLTWKVALTVTFGPSDDAKDTPYRGKAGIVGFFTVSEQWPHSREQLVSVNGPSVLYGAVREMVATLTARCSHGTHTLPTLTFAHMATGSEEPKQTTPPSASKKEPKQKGTTAKRRARRRALE